MNSLKVLKNQTKTTGIIDNLKSFGLGLLESLLEDDKLESKITSCLALFSTETTAAAVKTDEKPETTVASGDAKSTWETVLTYVGKAVDLVCKIKDKILGWLTKRYRRYMRLFLEGKLKNGIHWSLSGIWESIKEHVKTAVGAVTDAITTAKNWIHAQFEPFLNAFEAMKQKVIDFLKQNPFLKFIIEHIQNIKDCKTLGDDAKKLWGLLTSLVTFIPTLATANGWVTLLVNLVCSWKKLKLAIEALVAGIKESDAVKKARQFGKFAGNLVLGVLGK